MPSRSPHGGGDGGEAGRRSLLLRPSTTVRMGATERALLGLLAARRAVPVNTLIEEAVSQWLRREIATLTEESDRA